MKPPVIDQAVFKERRKKLRHLVANQEKTSDNDFLLIGAGFEKERYRFRQDSSFYYLTGIHEPAVILCSFFDGNEILYVPNFGNERHTWVEGSISLNDDPAQYGVNEICPLSDKVSGYSYDRFFKQPFYEHLLRDLEEYVESGATTYSLINKTYYFEQTLLMEAFSACLPSLQKSIKDVSQLLHEMRRAKDIHEQELISKAVDITINAEYAACKAIKAGVYEFDVHAAIEHSFIKQGAQQPSFPSIVATGINSTILHYTGKHAQLREGDLVVIDIGAEYGMYAADLTRTYPVGGRFSERQRTIYQIVLDAQQYIFSLAKPGMFLRNAQAQEESLHYCAVQFIKKAGYGDYFPHGLGHYLGLDVHDVGNYNKPLDVGDVFTIEPGIYLRNEQIGVRIEDNFVITKNGAECLSKRLPSSIADIEHMMSS